MSDRNREMKDGAEFARPDFSRKERTGAPEVVFCQGKTPEQIASIMVRLSRETEENIFGTRATHKDHDAVVAVLPQAMYHEEARIIAVPGKRPAKKEGAVAVLTAGTADIPVGEEAAVTAELLGNRVTRIYDVGVAGIHRLLDCIDEIKEHHVIIAVAGMEGALPSVVAGMVDVPVIAVPTSVGYGANFDGLSALLTMINGCASGVGVVNIDNGYGAACLADKITGMIGKQKTDEIDIEIDV